MVAPLLVQGTSLQGTIDELMCLLLVIIICQLWASMELVCASFWLLLICDVWNFMCCTASGGG